MPTSKAKTLETIAAKAGFETLETRKSDSLDFVPVAVWDMRKALEEAYTAGTKSVK